MIPPPDARELDIRARLLNIRRDLSVLRLAVSAVTGDDGHHMVDYLADLERRVSGVVTALAVGGAP